MKKRRKNLDSSKDNNVKEQKLKRRQRANNNNNTITNGKKLWTKLVFVGLLASVISIIVFYRLQTEEKRRHLSQVVYQHVDVNNQLINTMNAIEHLLEEDPLAEIMKKSLRPVQERISSLRTQTRMYEEMGHISGGPTHFMQTTLKELDQLIIENIIPLDVQVILVLSAYKKRVDLVSQTIMDLVRSHSIAVEDMATPEYIYILINEGVMLIPDTETLELNPNFINETKGNLTISDISEKLTRLAELFKEREHVFFKVLEKYENTSPSKQIIRDLTLISDMIRDIDVESPDSEYAPFIDELEIIGYKIEEEIKLNGKFYKLTIPLRSESMQKLFEVRNQLYTAHENKREPYLMLKNMIMKDIENLKIRIQNMQYKYIKIKPQS